MANLIDRIKEKPFKSLVMLSVGTTFFRESLEKSKDMAEAIDKYGSQIRDVVGYAGYWIGQIGLTSGMLLVTAGLGCIATLGAGRVMDEYWYGRNLPERTARP